MKNLYYISIIAIALGSAVSAAHAQEDVFDVPQVQKKNPLPSDKSDMQTLIPPPSDEDRAEQIQKILSDPTLSGEARAAALAKLQAPSNDNGGNTANIVQSGSDNHISIKQTGSKNYAKETQTGKANDLQVNQQGQHNRSVETQTGNYNHRVITQNKDTKEHTDIDKSPTTHQSTDTDVSEDSDKKEENQ